MKRKDLITALQTAGYHDDRKAWTRLYVENRISFEKAEEAWREGRQAKARGVRCDCFECKGGV